MSEAPADGTAAEAGALARREMGSGVRGDADRPRSRSLAAVLLACSPGARRRPDARSRSSRGSTTWTSARNAFSEAVITARASQVEDGKVTGRADFQIYTKGRRPRPDRLSRREERRAQDPERRREDVADGARRLARASDHAEPAAARRRVRRRRRARRVRRGLQRRRCARTREDVGGKTCRVLDLDGEVRNGRRIPASFSGSTRRSAFPAASSSLSLPASRRRRSRSRSSRRRPARRSSPRWRSATCSPARRATVTRLEYLDSAGEDRRRSSSRRRAR